MKGFYLLAFAVVILGTSVLASRGGGGGGGGGGSRGSSGASSQGPQSSMFREEIGGDTNVADLERDGSLCSHTYVVERAETVCRMEPSEGVQEQLIALEEAVNELRSDTDLLLEKISGSAFTSRNISRIYSELLQIRNEMRSKQNAYCFFTLHPTAGLRGNNQRELSGLSEEQCVQACLDASDFFCRSIDFCGVASCGRGKCYLSAQSRDTVPADYGSWEGWDYLHRVCMGTPSPPAPMLMRAGGGD